MAISSGFLGKGLESLYFFQYNFDIDGNRLEPYNLP